MNSIGLSTVTLVFLCAFPLAVNAHCDEVMHSGIHPHCLEDLVGNFEELSLTLTNKIVSFQTIGDLSSIPKQCSVTGTHCNIDFDCSGALNVCTPDPDSLGDLNPTLLVSLATSVATLCGVDRVVAISLDAVTPVELIEERLLRQSLNTALGGPYRVKFWIARKCKIIDGLSYPVATDAQLVQDKAL